MLKNIKIANLILALIAFAILGSLVGCDDGKKGGGGPVTSPNGIAILCDRTSLTDADYRKCIEENRSSLSGNAWIGVLKVTNKGEFKDLLEDSRICDISGWWSPDDNCSDWDDEVGVIVDAAELVYPADAGVSVVALGNGWWSGGVTSEKYLRNMTGEITAVNEATNGNIQQAGVRIIFLHPALVDGPMEVEVRYNNVVVASGTVERFEDYFY